MEIEIRVQTEPVESKVNPTLVNSVSKDVKEQIKWFCLFFTEDRDSFEDCLRENDVIPDKDERNILKNVFKIDRIQSLF